VKSLISRESYSDTRQEYDVVRIFDARSKAYASLVYSTRIRTKNKWKKATKAENRQHEIRKTVRESMKAVWLVSTSSLVEKCVEKASFKHEWKNCRRVSALGDDDINSH